MASNHSYHPSALSDHKQKAILPSGLLDQLCHEVIVHVFQETSGHFPVCWQCIASRHLVGFVTETFPCLLSCYLGKRAGSNYLVSFILESGC